MITNNIWGKSTVGQVIFPAPLWLLNNWSSGLKYHYTGKKKRLKKKAAKLYSKCIKLDQKCRYTILYLPSKCNGKCVYV